MATWVRTNTNSPSATDDVPEPFNTQVTLGNGTAPGDFDPAAVNSVRIQWDFVVANRSDDNWTDYQEAVLSDGSPTLASVDGGNATRTANGTYSKDITDNSPSNAATTTDWENATLRVGANGAWALWVKNKGPDGITGTINNVTVTIDYTPSSATQNLTPSTLSVSPTFPTATLVWDQFLTPTLLSVSPSFPTASIEERSFPLVQVASDTGAADAKVTVTYGSATTSGNFLVAGVFSRDGTKPPVPSGWTEELAVEDTTNADWFVMYSKESDGTETSVTLGQTGGGNDYNAGWIAEYSGFSGTPTVETAATAGASYAVNSLDVSSGTVTNTPALMVASHTARDWGDTIGNAISYDSLFEERADEGGGTSGNTWTHIGMADAENTDGASDTATMTPNETAMDMMAGMLVIYDGTSDQFLTPSLLSVTPSFPTATLIQEQFLTPSLLSLTPSFGTATISATYDITGSLLSITASFPQAAVTSTYNVDGVLVTVTPSFPTATVTPGNVNLIPSTLSVAASFGTATVTEAVTLTPTLLSLTASFPTATVTEDVTLTPTLLSVVTNFPTATLVQEQFLEASTVVVSTTFPFATINQQIQGALLSVTPTFPTAEIKATTILASNLVSLTPGFPQAAVTATYDIQGDLLTVTPTFGTATIREVQFVTPTLLSVTATFGTATVTSTYDITGVTLTPTVSFPQATADDGSAEQDLQPSLLSLTPSFPTATLGQTIAPSAYSVVTVFPSATLGVTINPGTLGIIPTFPSSSLGSEYEVTGAGLNVITTFGTSTVTGSQGITANLLSITVAFPQGNLANSGVGFTPEDTEAQGIAQEMAAFRGLSGTLDWLGSLNALNGGTDLDKLGVLVALGATPGADVLLALEQLAFDGQGKGDFNELMRRWAESGNY